MPLIMAAVKSRPFLLNLRAMFYMVTPSETSFEKLEDVPNFVDEVTMCLWFIFIFF